MNYMKIDKSSINNGLGWRVVLWVSGCTLKCENCHNPETWDFNAGKPFDETAKQFLFEQLSKPYIKGITFSGGHVIERRTTLVIYDLIKEIKNKFPSKDIWLYTGLKLSMDDFTTWEQDMVIPKEIFRMCDVVVDGPYIEEQRDISLAFRGSRNQRLIDVKETLKQGKIITLQND